MIEGLNVALEDDLVRIELPLPVLKQAADIYYSQQEDPLQIDSKPIEVSNEREFAESVIRRLCDEEEDGSTLVTRMFDKAFDSVVEQGDDGIDWGDEM